MFKPPLPSEAVLALLAMLLAVAGLYIVATPSDRWTKHLIISLEIGFAIYGIRLIVFSSWRIWVWYDYPAIMFYAACIPPILVYAYNWLEARYGGQTLLNASSMLCILMTFTLSVGLLLKEKRSEGGYYPVSKKAIEQYMPVLKGEMVAMGDRAGNFAYQYPGGVTQTEGLVDDREYLTAIRTHANIKALLCRRNVKYLVAFEPNIGDYRTFKIETIRRDQSQYKSPMIEVSRSDEVGVVSDFASYPPHAGGENYVYLYIWRLNCSQ